MIENNNNKQIKHFWYPLLLSTLLKSIVSRI